MMTCLMVAAVCEMFLGTFAFVIANILLPLALILTLLGAPLYLIFLFRMFSAEAPFSGMGHFASFTEFIQNIMQ